MKHVNKSIIIKLYDDASMFADFATQISTALEEQSVLFAKMSVNIINIVSEAGSNLLLPDEVEVQVSSISGNYNR